MCDVENCCGCRVVVTRTYRELKKRNVPDVAAFDTAITIFRMHHPEVSVSEARYSIAAWVDEKP